MAFMEQQPQPMSGRKPPLDDTVPLITVIEASQSLQSHTVNGSNLSRADLCLRSQISGLNLPLPPKKLLGNMDREFIAERQKGLQAYLNYITRHHILSSCELVKKFLDTNNYSANYTEIALQQVSMFFRSDPKWEVIEPLKDIGWRLRKRYFLVKDKDQPKDKQVLSWVDLGPDKFLSDKDLLSAVKLLPTLSHSNIAPVSFATTSESSALVIRVFSEKGTLRDHICKVKPKEPFLKKYCNPKKIQGLEQQQIQTYGRQILEALKFLHDKGFPYGHLHASNVLIEENTCKLLDIENSLLGLPSYYRPYVTQFRKIYTTESIDVYSFGHLLYEMTYGRPPDAVPVDQYPPPPFSSVVSVLQSILSTEACKTGMPTVSQLLQTPLFNDVLLFNSEKPQFKISSKLKEALKSSKECLEKHLVEEQRTIHQHKRLTRAQSHHGSEEEKRKRKILARKVHEFERFAIIRICIECSHRFVLNIMVVKTKTPVLVSEIETLHLTDRDGLFSLIPAGAPPAPPLPPPAPPPPGNEAVPPSLLPPSANGTGRSALLSSIQSFSKGKLKKSETVDRSVPRL
uniref:PX domain-containing protein kinase-like protein n=1 Tax=Sinocyclocheilus rhinocerous TaxID=307959 RepID=A0A673I412_9TELE